MHDALEVRRPAGRALFPTAELDPDVLFVDDGDLVTSAGTAAGIDACLHLVRREVGTAAATAIARRMVVAPQRDGGQRQFIEQPLPVRCSEGFAPHLDWILANLRTPHTVDDASRRGPACRHGLSRAASSRRPAHTPMQWVTDQRVLYARRLLEETDLDIDQSRRPVGLRHRDAAAPPLPPDHRRDAVGLPAQLCVQQRSGVRSDGLAESTGGASGYVEQSARGGQFCCGLCSFGR